MTLAPSLTIASTPAARVTGLLNHAVMDPRESLLIPNASSIHTHGMKFPIDVIFLSGSRVVGLVPNLQPGNRVSCPDASSVLELPAGRIAEAQVQIGDMVSWTQSAGLGQVPVAGAGTQQTTVSGGFPEIFGIPLPVYGLGLAVVLLPGYWKLLPIGIGLVAYEYLKGLS